MPHETTNNESPATLVAIIVAARRAGDRDLERHARRELERRFNVRLSFAGSELQHAGRQPQEVANA